MSQANGQGRASELIPDHVEPAAKPQQKRPRSPLHLHPVGWFQNAISFRSAADLLFEAIASPDNKRPLRDPVYFLYHQAVELALKACLTSRGLKVPEGGKDQHDIGKLFEWCRKEKLLGLGDKHFNTHNLIALLGQGNRWQRYRYPGPNPNNEHDHVIPDLGWLHETVGQLFEAVEPHVAQWVAKNPSPPPPTIRAALKLLGPLEPIPISLPAGDAIIAPAVGEPSIDPVGCATHDPTGPPAKVGVCNP